MKSAVLSAATRRYPLFDAYPDLEDRLPREPFSADFAPVHELRHLPEANIWIKRDDRTSLIYGGTKVRKLELLLGEARALRKSKIVSMGAAGSHFLLSTAVFARELDLAFEAILCDQHMSDGVRRNVLTLFDQSTILRYGGSQLSAAAYFGSRLLQKRKEEYFLAPGGSSPLGTIGVVNAAFELKAQIAEGLLPPPAIIVCALGSGGTLAGLALGARMARLKSEVVGVRVYPGWVGPFPVVTRARVCRLMKATLHLLKQFCPSIPNFSMPVPRILDDYMGRGYAIPNGSGEVAKQLLADREGIELDSTYTAKTFAAVLDLQRDRSKTSDVLYWHTFAGEFAKGVQKLENHRKLPAALQFMF